MWAAAAAWPGWGRSAWRSAASTRSVPMRPSILIAAAMSIEGLMGTDLVLAADLQALRPHPGQAAAAAHMRALLKDSPIAASHRGPEDGRVQDPYSLRCSPQVHGAARDTFDYAAVVAGRELSAAIDNPTVLADGS